MLPRKSRGPLGLLLVSCGGLFGCRRAETTTEIRPAPSGESSAAASASARPAPPTPSEASVRMALIPAGAVRGGDRLGPHSNAAAIEVQSFWMDIHETPVGFYNKCVTAGVCTPLAGRETLYGGGVGPKLDRMCLKIQKDPSLPATCVSQTQAAAFCQWVGKRLPTSAEWELAAAGAVGRLYPWGADAPGEGVCWNRGGEKSVLEKLMPCAVGSSPKDVSPHGILDLAGNVSEWTTTSYVCCMSKSGWVRSECIDGSCDAERGIIVRGGDAFESRLDHMQYSHYYTRWASDTNTTVGFRCVKAAAAAAISSTIADANP